MESQWRKGRWDSVVGVPLKEYHLDLWSEEKELVLSRRALKKAGGDGMMDWIEWEIYC